MSPIAHAEYSVDAGPWQFVAPVGELSDSQAGAYEFQLPHSMLGGQDRRAPDYGARLRPV